MNRTSYKSYLLTLLLVSLAFNFSDRYALGVLLQDIKIDLDLSDTQLGLLTGIMFAFFYSVMGIPIARWADRGNRVTVMSVAGAVGSVMISACGIAANFAQLLLMRAGVAAGEAGCMPPAHSLIADYFTRAKRPRAVAIYMLGVPLSMIIGFFFAGWINELYGWRVTFMLLGLPGLGLAALVRFSVKEPRKENPTSRGGRRPCSAVTSQSVKEAFAILWGTHTFRHLLLCYSVMYFFWGGIGKWQPAFFMRSHGLSTGELGTWFALIWGGGGLLGTYLGGELASRFAAHNERLQLKVMAVIVSSFGLISVFVYLSPNLYMAFALMGVAMVGITTTSGPVFATVQTLVPPDMRAVALAVMYFFANLIGMGLGPLAAGVLSDAFMSWGGQESLRYALVALCPGYLWAGWHLWLASKVVGRDLAAMRSVMGPESVSAS